jgi:hypothetical protein
MDEEKEGFNHIELNGGEYLVTDDRASVTKSMIHDIH